MNRLIAFVMCVAACVAQTPLPSQQDSELSAFLGRKILPVDEAVGHPGLVKFRAQLIAAATRQDLNYFLSVIEPGIGGCGWEGVEGFRAFVSEAGGWDSIRRALELGGVMHSATLFRSNYVMMKFPRGADMTSYLVVTRPDAVVHEKPELNSAVVSKLRYEMVAPLGDGAQWQKIEYRPGKVGYVLSGDVERPTGYGVSLELKRGKWLIRRIASYCD